MRNLAMILRIYGADVAGIEIRVLQLLRDFDLLPLALVRVQVLSRGQIYKAGLVAMGRQSSWTWILSNGEFLLSRPIPRFRIYATLWALAFEVLMICPVINLVFTAFHPDFLLS